MNKMTYKTEAIAQYVHHHLTQAGYSAVQSGRTVTSEVSMLSLTNLGKNAKEPTTAPRKYPEPGTVIHGTMRAQDLIPAFFPLVEEFAPTKYSALIDEHITPLEVSLETLLGLLGDVPEESAWWHSQDCDILLEDLFETLNDLSPPGHYFGSHPGDGSDFGFWESEIHGFDGLTGELS